MTTETRTYQGDTGGQHFDGWAGFRVGQAYELTYTKEFDILTIHLPHAPGRQIALSQAEYEQLFKK